MGVKRGRSHCGPIFRKSLAASITAVAETFRSHWSLRSSRRSRFDSMLCLGSRAIGRHAAHAVIASDDSFYPLDLTGRRSA